MPAQTVINQTAKLQLGDKSIDLPIVVGTENEHAVDISKLRSETGYITLDNGFGNTGSCRSAITYIDGEKGILRYRGYPMEALAKHSTFLEVAWLLIFGELPQAGQVDELADKIKEHSLLHQDMRHHFEGFPASAHPMAVLSAMINASSCYHPELLEIKKIEESSLNVVAMLMAKVATIAAFSYKKSIGEPQRYPDPSLDYGNNFLHCMFSKPYGRYTAEPEVVRALDLFLMLHADHEQNCSTSTARVVGSSEANLFASMASAVCALWGPLHGGANQRCIEMLETIHRENLDVKKVVERVKNREFKLMGFGHRVYKSSDPRATILKAASDDLLGKLGVDDPLLPIAEELEDVARHDDYFLERNLYPNVDFYSGIILRTIGIPIEMFTVMFAIGRMPGWIAHWKEQHEHPSGRIARPRQVYIGATERDYVAVDRRG
jgi:citrate synthase